MHSVTYGVHLLSTGHFEYDKRTRDRSAGREKNLCGRCCFNNNPRWPLYICCAARQEDYQA
jgi:hypothetical protein